MAKINILLLAFLLHICGKKTVYAQEIDTGRVILNSKVLLIEYLSRFEDKQYFEDFLSYTPDVAFLKTKGSVTRFVFYKIRVNDTIIIKRKTDSKMTIQCSFFPYYDGVVFFAFDTINHKIYRLNGFENNDINEFFHDFRTYYEVFSGVNITCRNIEEFASIEEIDLKCMCRSVKRKKPCFRPLKPYYY